MAPKRKYQSAFGGVPQSLTPARTRLPPGYRRTPPPPGRPPTLRIGLGRRGRINTGRSYTATRRRRGRYNKVVKRGENSSATATRMGSYMTRFNRMMYKKLVARRVNASVSSTRSTSAAGQQSVFASFNLDKTQLVALKDDIVGASGDANEYKFFIKYVKRTSLIRNQSNSVVKLSLYDVSLKKQPNGTAADTPIECWEKGLADFGLGSSAAQQPGMTPYRSPEFNRYFYVKRVSTVYLEAGQQHEHTFIHRINRLVPSTVFDNSGSLVSFQGLTTWTMAVFLGSLGHESLTPGNVSIMPATLDILTRSEVHYGYLESKAPKYTWTNNLPATVTNFDFMGETGDADVDPVAA